MDAGGGMMEGITQPTHDYVGRDEHGCLIALIADIPELKRETAKEVASWIREGLTVTRVTMEDVRHILDTEDMGCSKVLQQKGLL
jgi:hypothetical protein